MAIFFVAFNAALAPQEALQALRGVLNAKKSHRITTGAWLLEVPDPKRAIDLRIELLHYVPKESDVNLSVIRVDHSANDGTAIAVVSRCATLVGQAAINDALWARIRLQLAHTVCLDQGASSQGREHRVR
jgi:hypothetical protein